MRIEIAKLHQRLEATMIYTTRDSAEAMSLAGRLVVLRDGFLQQNDAPSAVYAAPANMFVAGFIGDPSMNLIRGTLKQERDALLFRELEDGTIEARLPVSDRARAVEFAGRPVVLGIRPEDVALAQASPSPHGSPSTFPALVEVVEPMGAETNLYLQTGAHTLVCRSPGAIDRREAGRRMRFAIDPTRTHLFDPISTERLAWP
jgi:multiple sugar transport system ATP-binding protein